MYICHLHIYASAKLCQASPPPVHSTACLSTMNYNYRMKRATKAAKASSHASGRLGMGWPTSKVDSKKEAATESL